MPDLVQEDINKGGNIYQFALVEYDASDIDASNLNPVFSAIPEYYPIAQKLATPRKIGNADFDGSGDITLAEIGAGFTAAVITPGSGYGTSLSRVSVSDVYVDVIVNLTKSSAIAYQDVICTLPANARPQVQFDVAAIVRNASSGEIGLALVTFSTSGNVVFASTSPSSNLTQIIVKTGFALR